jgi:hypothetical protein
MDTKNESTPHSNKNQSVVSKIQETLIQVFPVQFYRPVFVLDLQAVNCTTNPAS